MRFETADGSTPFVPLDIPVDDSPLSLSKLHYVRHIIVPALPPDDFTFLERLVCVTPNLSRLRISVSNLLEIIRHPRRDLCQMLAQQISQLEIHVGCPWLSDIPRDISKVNRIFSNIKSLRISFSFYAVPTDLSRLLKELLKSLIKLQGNLLCITIQDKSPTSYESFPPQDRLSPFQTWLQRSSRTSSHIEWNSSSVTIWS